MKLHTVGAGFLTTFQVFDWSMKPYKEFTF